MSNNIYHIKIKKERAFAVIDLLHISGAIEILPGETPEWQIEETMRRLAELDANPSLAMSKEEFFTALDKD